MTFLVGVLLGLYVLAACLAWAVARRRRADETTGKARLPSEVDHPRRFSRRHAWAAVWATGPAVLCVLVLTGSPLIAADTLLGPMAGPVARDWQSCCLDNGLAVLPCGVTSLALALSTQWLLPDVWGGRLRLAGWILGWAGWCFCGLVTYLHALE